MTLVFVAVLLAAFALDLLVIRRWEQGRRSVHGDNHETATEIVVPRTLFFHPGHTWARLEPDGTVTVGLDDLARTVIGNFSAVDLPAVGERLTAGKPAVGVHQTEGRLLLPAPVSGTVTEVNRALGTDPVRLRWRPYKEGWAFRMAPDDSLGVELGRLHIGRNAERWMRQELDRLSRMVDAGILDLPIAGALHRAGAEVRRRVIREIFRVEPGAAEIAP